MDYLDQKELNSEKNAAFWPALVRAVSIENEERIEQSDLQILAEVINGFKHTVVVPKEISLHELAEKVKIASIGFNFLNDLFYGCGYEYCEDYPDRAERDLEDKEEKGWVGIMIQRYGEK